MSDTARLLSREELCAARLTGDGRLRQAIRRRVPKELPHKKILVIAADHPARAAFSDGTRPRAMENRYDLLLRIETALSVEGVNGYLGNPDTVEDLMVSGLLDDKLVFGSMNRGGIINASWEIDDRMTGYTTKTIQAQGLTGGKMLLRIDRDDPKSARTLRSCAKAVTDLAENSKIAMVEPFMSSKKDGRITNLLDTDSICESAAIASGIGATSQYTWLKLPLCQDMERVASSTTLPIVVLGGPVAAGGADPIQAWKKALALPNVIGLVIGRFLLYPPDGDVYGAVSRAAELINEQ